MATMKSGEHSNKTIVYLLLSHLFTCSAIAVTSRLDSPIYRCTCPGDTLIYNCTVVGGGSTLWTGRDFDCPSTSNDIVLLHSEFQGEIGDCSNGTIVGRGVRVENGNVFVSQLSVPVTLNSAGASVQCIYNNGASSTLINSSTISLISAPFAQPNDVTLSHADRGLITFSWSPVPSDCPLSYRISSTCGDCPSSTDNTTVDCSVTDLSTEDIACEFSVQSVVCGSFVSTSNRISLNVNAPSVPGIQNVLPVYYDNSTLKRVQVQFSESTSFNIYNGVDGSAKEYNISYFVGTSSSSCYSAIVPASSCANGVCNHSFAVSSSCLSSADINVAVFATNVLGDSQTSIPFTTSVDNDFVSVSVNVSTNTINCTFLTGMSASEKHCSVVYGPCSQTPTQSAQKSVNGSTNSILLILRFNQQSDYCYTLSASNNDFAVQVEGIVKIDEGSSNNVLIGIIVGVFVLCIVVVIGISALVFVICLTRKRKQLTFRDPNNRVSFHLLPTYNPISQDRNLEKLYVEDASELREFIVKCKGSYKRGCVFYQFINKFEDITENQEVIRMKKEDTDGENNCIIFYEGHDIVGKGGPKKKRPSDNNYLAFIQCTGPGVRYLPAESYILYEEKADKTNDDLTTSSNDLPEWKSLVHICSNAFMISNVPKDCSLNTFCESVQISKNKSNAFPEVKHLGDYNLDNVRDVILSEKKKNSMKLFSGPNARHMLQQYQSDHSFDLKWNMFVVFKKPQGTLQLTEGSLVLHQNPAYYVAEMAVLSVDDKCVQVADFLENKKNNDGDGDIQRLFYEFTGDEEDLDSFREVVTATSNGLRQKCFKTDWNNYGIEMFYHNSLKTPGIGIKKPGFSGLKMFIQCVENDLTRCLKPGTVVVYKQVSNFSNDPNARIVNYEGDVEVHSPDITLYKREAKIQPGIQQLTKKITDYPQKCFVNQSVESETIDTSSVTYELKHVGMNAAKVTLLLDDVEDTCTPLTKSHFSSQQSTYFNEALRRGKVPFLHHQTLELSSSGHEYTNPDCDISVKVPQGAVAEGEFIHIEVAVALYGPFVLQGITRPISPIIWVCIMEENALLKKPFQIIIPHCLVGLSDEQLQLHGVHFAKASHSNYYFDSYGQLRYKFEKCSMKPQFISSGDKTYAILETDHCCFYCLTANKTHQMSLDAGYSLTRIESFAQHKSKVHFVATYFLDTCIQSLKDQFPEQEGYVIARTDLFKFKEDEVQEHIKIHLPQSKATSHYSIGMEPAEAKINMSDIDFWKDKYDYRSMHLKHKLKMYPPRVIMTVTMKTSTFVLPVKFEGSTKNVLDMELTFPLEYLPVSPSSSVSSGGAHSMKLPLQCDKNDLQNIFGKLLPICDKWRTIGALVGVSPDALRVIEADFRGNSQDCLLEMLNRRLKQDNPVLTWENLNYAVSQVDSQVANTF